MKQKILITSGPTSVPVDQVRNISNVLRHDTGSEIAAALCEEGADVTLITSNFRWAIKNLKKRRLRQDQLKIITYTAYMELYLAMEREIKTGKYDVVIHSADVSDYNVSEICVMENEKLVSIDRSKKISSNYSDLYLHLTPTAKIVDRIRDPWGFDGFLVKFNQQVGIDDSELIAIAKKSRTDSRADMVIANCLWWPKNSAYIITETDEMFVSQEGLVEKTVEIISNVFQTSNKST